MCLVNFSFLPWKLFLVFFFSLLLAAIFFLFCFILYVGLFDVCNVHCLNEPKVWAVSGWAKVEMSLSHRKKNSLHRRIDCINFRVVVILPVSKSHNDLPHKSTRYLNSSPVWCTQIHFQLKEKEKTWSAYILHTRTRTLRESHAQFHFDTLIMVF